MEDTNKFYVRKTRINGTTYYGINEWPCSCCAATTVRGAIKEHLRKLIEETSNMTEILKSDVVGQAEIMMSDTSSFQVNEICLTAPVATLPQDELRANIDTFLKKITNPEE